MAAFNRMIVAYDDRKLRIFYLDSFGEWKQKDLSSLYGWASMGHNAIGRFGLDSSKEATFLNSLDMNGLQIYKNLIVMSSVDITSDVLQIKTKSFLIDENYELRNERAKTIDGENIFLLDHKAPVHTEEGTTEITIKYVLEGRIYRLKVVSFTGALLDKINEMKDENERNQLMQDTSDELNKNSNEQFKSMTLFDWPKYSVKLKEQKILIGIGLQLSGHRVMSCAKNHSDPKRKSQDGHIDYSDFFIVGNVFCKENHIIFVLSLDDLDSLHGKLPLHAVKGRILKANYWELEPTWTSSVSTVLAWSLFWKLLQEVCYQELDKNTQLFKPGIKRQFFLLSDT
jgi:hypothetical protein